MGLSGPSVETYLAAVVAKGSEFGLALHFGKTQLLRVRSVEDVHLPSGEAVAGKNSMVYLGGLLHSGGRPEHELSRRLGLANADFRTLSRVWGTHA